MLMHVEIHSGRFLGLNRVEPGSQMAVLTALPRLQHGTRSIPRAS
jgi:hypothetical protein